MIDKIKKWFQQVSVHDTDADSIDNSHLEEATFVLMFESLPIGELSFDGENWKFIYTKMFQHQDKIEPLTAFPVLDRTYVSPILWPFFQARIPSLKQPKIREIVEKKGVKENDIIALLKLFGAKSINNPFVLQG